MKKFALLLVCFLLFASSLYAGDGFDNDPSCVAYWPLYKYDQNTAMIWDQVANGTQHPGTIVQAVPASAAMINGIELVQNGNFPNATFWTFNAGWTFDAVDLQADKSADGIDTLVQPVHSVPVIPGKKYKLGYLMLNWTVGDVTPSFGGVTGTVRSANGFYEDYFTAATADTLTFTPSNTARFSIDFVSVQEVQHWEGGLGWFFDGINDRITTTLNDVPPPVTYATWVFFCRSPAGQLNNAFIFGNGDVNVGSRGMWLRRPNNTTFAFRWQVGDDSGAFGQINSTNKQCEWGFELATHNGTDMFVYRDGVLATSATRNKATSALTYEFGHSDGLAVAANSWYVGWVGETWIFSRFFNRVDVKNLFEQTRLKYGMYR